MSMITDLEKCIQFINDNGGLTVVGWYNRGVFNDNSIIDSQKSIMLTAVILPRTTILTRSIRKLTQGK